MISKIVFYLYSRNLCSGGTLETAMYDPRNIRGVREFRGVMAQNLIIGLAMLVLLLGLPMLNPRIECDAGGHPRSGTCTTHFGR